jgi:radical SAM family RiPP maturation amino acid epimerase
VLGHVHSENDKRFALDAVNDERLRAWISRQRKRMTTESALIRKTTRGLTAPVAFELSDGCGGQCPFCFLSSGKLKNVFKYTQDNATLWLEALEAVRDVIGDALSSGICYYATEPFDNPDYEMFLSDFKRVSGCFPQTTTAYGDKDIERTKRFISMLGEEALRVAALRMSVVSLKQLRRIHDAFTADELAYVELLLNNPESTNSYSNAGRARLLNAKHVNVSSGCVTGFIINMPNKTVTLAAPYPPDDKYPTGMKVYESMSFVNGADLKGVLLSLIEKWMPQLLPCDTALCLSPGVGLRRDGDYIVLTANGGSRVISAYDNLHECLTAVEAGTTVNEAFERLQIDDGKRGMLLDKLNFLYGLGYFEEAL